MKSIKNHLFFWGYRHAAIYLYRNKLITREYFIYLWGWFMEKTKELPIGRERVVEITGYKPSYINQLIHKRQIPFHKPRGRVYFFESEILDFVSRNRKVTDYEVADQADAILNGETK